MPEDDRPSPEQTEPPGPQPDDAGAAAGEGDSAEETTEDPTVDPSVDKTSADSFPASDPPSW